MLINTGKCFHRFDLSGGGGLIKFDGVTTELKGFIMDGTLYKISDAVHDCIASPIEEEVDPWHSLFMIEPDEKRANETVTGDV